MSAYQQTFPIKRLWIILLVTVSVMFSVLLYFGGQIYQQAPPIPEQVVSEDGDLIITGDQIRTGQQVWRSMGGMQMGSVWGHGSYLAPDWTADWLHREATTLLALQAQQHYQKSYANLDKAEQGYIKALLQDEMRTNRYAPETERITISSLRAEAIARVAAHYQKLFSLSPDSGYPQLQEQFALSPNVALNENQIKALNAFFFWTAWSATTERPGDTITYTSNWPHEPLVGNTPSAALFIWTFVSIVFLLAGIAALTWYYIQQYDNWREDLVPEQGIAKQDFAKGLTLTPSMRSTLKYFWTVGALILLQITLGIVTAHYTVEGQELYGIPLADIIPYSITRTWHTQLAVLWIATAWLATGLFVAPLISGHEPRFQRFGVNFLYVSLLIIVLGSFVGQWLGIQQKMGHGELNFWFGHQGYEYVDLGRFWQAFLFIGLLIWVLLMLRAMWPAFKSRKNYHLLILLVLATIAIGLLYGAGLLWGHSTHLSVVEYWRWWVVHLWVEGVFEVFATAIIAIIFVKIGLLRASTATIAVLFATFIFLSGGVLGTFHHLYFAGTPIAVLALGGVFSALEVVPLVVISFEVYSHYKIERMAPDWIKPYHWPLLFFIAVAFWNLVGAGLLGFLINPPLALYYMQGLNTTPLHGHAALFGVYGLLGIGLILFCLSLISDRSLWHHKLLKISFWSFNLGLALMLLFSLLPIGILQTYQSYTEGYWSARAPEFIHSDTIQWLIWARVPGDVLFAIGAASFALFLFKVWRSMKSA